MQPYEQRLSEWHTLHRQFGAAQQHLAVAVLSRDVSGELRWRDESQRLRRELDAALTALGGAIPKSNTFTENQATGSAGDAATRN